MVSKLDDKGFFVESGVCMNSTDKGIERCKKQIKAVFVKSGLRLRQVVCI